jgi:hypothetical protein
MARVMVGIVMLIIVMLIIVMLVIVMLIVLVLVVLVLVVMVLVVMMVLDRPCRGRRLRCGRVTTTDRENIETTQANYYLIKFAAH